MSDFFWVLGCFLIVLAAYSHIRRQSTKEAEEETPADIVSPTASALACVQIVDIITTNNSYNPMGYVLASLTFPQVHELLGGELRADMKGYIP